MDGNKVQFYPAIRGDARGQFPVQSVPLSQSRPKSNPAFSACRTFTAWQAEASKPVEEADPFAYLFTPRIFPPSERLK